MTQSINILMAQMNPIMGAIELNTDRIVQIILDHQATHDVIVFPELALCGYPPEDLLLRPELFPRLDAALQTICAATKHCHVIVGHPHQLHDKCYNAASIFYAATLQAQYLKQQLPNYGVFDEKRYFTPGPPQLCLFTSKNYRIGLCICEDLWQGDTIHAILQAGIDILIVMNASPFDTTKFQLRQQLVAQKIQHAVPVVYVNLVGGQDELVFDGQSFVIDTQGQIVAQAPAFTEAWHSVTFHGAHITSKITANLDPLATIYQALMLGLRDYVEKNRIPGVLLGISGGVDSALTLAIAVDALGPDRVLGVILPSRYSAEMSAEDAQTQATTLKVKTHTLSIEPSFQALLSSLIPILPQAESGITAENLQARIRAILLMAISNQTGWMLISTSNKSETAVGFTTLYGDMCGGYAVLKDVLKTLVYELAHYRNTLTPCIPPRILTRAPSAELAPHQTDQDRLPDYATLDKIIVGYMEQNLSRAQLLALGYPRAAIDQTLQLILYNEYKRQQAPPGPKISPRAFGRDWRYPITDWIDK